MSGLSSYLTCNLVPRRGAAVDPYDVEGPQPQTATCCTALQRYAPLRTPASAALLPPSQSQQPAEPPPPTTTINPHTTTINHKLVRKCKSTVDDSQLIQGPRLRRSVAVRRDWSFEDLQPNKAA